MNDSVKTSLDVAAGTTALLTLVQWLPPIASALTIIWMTIRIYETETFQKILAWVKSKLS